MAQAEGLGANLVLLKILGSQPDTPVAGRPGVKIAEQMSGDLTRDCLEGIASPLREQGLQGEVVTIEGKPYVEILRYAESHQIDLIAMTTQGQSGFSRWLPGSVAGRVVRGAAAPLPAPPLGPGPLRGYGLIQCHPSLCSGEAAPSAVRCLTPAAQVPRETTPEHHA